MKTVELQTVVYKEGTFFVSQCLDVDVSSFGKTEKEALGNLQEALELYLEDTQVTASAAKPKLHTLKLQNA